ncbi:MAG: hypothetical protein WCQ41_07120 [Bacillota bacterium]
MFDPLLTRIAVNWLEESDGSRHVGWLDENGALIDVTSLLSKGNSEFSKRPQHFNALFDAKGNFLFVDETTGMLNRYDLNNMTTVGKSSKVENSYGVIPYTIMLQPDGSIDTQLSDRLLTFCDLKLPNKIKISSNASYIIGGDGGVSIQDLIDDNRVLVMSQSENLKVAGIKGLKKNNSSENDIEDIVENIEPITIATDYKIENAAVSGDGKQIAFVAQRGQDRSLFVMPIDGSAEPKKVFEIDNLTFLLFWK